jgi:hypothetical protein
MKRILSAAILFLWTACFVHCSAESFGLIECNLKGEVAADCKSGGCSSEQDESEPDGNSPCGVCDYLSIGGVPTSSPLDAPGPGEFVPVVDFSTTEIRVQIDCASLESAAVISLSGESECLRLCEILACKSFPARGPNA